MRTRSALGFSFSLHLLLGLALAAARSGLPVSPNVVMVDWMESMPSTGNDAITASPNQRIAAKPAAPQSKTVPSAATNGLAKAGKEAPPAAGEYSPEAQARRMTLEESYLAGVRQTLERHKIYPPLAKRLGQTGEVTLKFEVGKGGEVLKSELANLSPYPVLNEAAKNLISAVRFPPIPDELRRPSWQFTYLVKYELN